MIGSLGFTEIAFILVLALLIFGPKRLPEIGRMVGKGLGEFRRASNDLKRTFNAELSLADDEDRPKLQRAPRAETRAAETGAAETGAAKAKTSAATAPVEAAQGSVPRGSGASSGGASEKNSSRDGAPGEEISSPNDADDSLSEA